MMKMLRSGVTATLVFGLLHVLASAAAPQAPPRPGSKKAAATATAAAREQVTPEETKKRKDWSDAMLRKAAPKKGCFNAAYPRTEWQEVTCVAAPNIPAGPRHGPRPAVVGNNNDVSAQAPSGHITQTIGHFENVTNVTGETGRIGNAGASIADTYTLQINSDFFSGSTACTGSPNPGGCLGWEQFIYWNTPASGGFAAIQYWLINYNAACPAGQNWNQIALFGGTSCWKNATNSVTVPNQPITNMADWRLTGTATATGDSVAMSTGTTVYTALGDNAVAASTAWTIAEFNIFGYGADNAGNGDTATFNAGASANTRTEIIYGGNTAPNCVAQGFTAEMNNLSFGPTAPTATGPGPAVIFTESIAGGATSSCAAAVTVGDTHLRTFNGLFYDFQAAGDFTLAEVAPGFSVQTRQVSGAPTWPDATVNRAVAARFGNTRVAVCAAPQGGDNATRILVDGKATPVANGQMLGLSEDVAIRRQGNVYQLVGADGHSVSATVNSYNNTAWIDVNVGLATWPSTVKGLIANVNGNVNQIATRDNVVLTNPFNFDELYHRFADSWRVSGDESMLSVCSRAFERSAPGRTFYATDLEAGVREKARAVCTAAGVTPGPYLDACTLDVAVIGQDAAAKVFVAAIAPVAVGTIVGGGGSILEKWWWLLLLLLLAIILMLWFLMRKKA